MNDPKLRIEFSVRDIETDRYVTFASDVSMVGIKEFFARAALGVEHIFDTARVPTMMRLTSVPVNKIAAIKLLRQYTNCDLITAKNVIEAGGELFVCDDGRDADSVIKAFNEIDASVIVSSITWVDETTLKLVKNR